MSSIVERFTMSRARRRFSRRGLGRDAGGAGGRATFFWSRANC
ncbi:hypothetical protein [Streptomyces cupreus]|nr:hypothetical protein [Streptomyces cupreus]